MTNKYTINQALEKDGVVILPPMDVFDSIALLKDANIHVECTMLDPWYNKGFGGVLPTEEYDYFIQKLLNDSGEVSELLYLWGFPEVIGPYVRYSPEGFYMSAWLTWYYKNCPSVIRGWRSSQNACLQFMRKGYSLHPEHFLNPEQKEKFAAGKMRFVPGPPSVIEVPLNIGFVGKKEQTGHPSQKPEAVFDKLILMATKAGDTIFDPMAGSGTSGASSLKNERKSILCDINEDYIQIMEKRLGVKRITL
ncbi:site-specific DNA-methyltransferase [Methanobacterium sp.]|uniref:DNA-methyltransferase n=1 Tax=Methanobacterium sp. TaxID=2164 RepID=UPI0031591DFA